MQATSEAPALIGTSGDSLREAFGKALSALADEFPQLVVLDADIAGGTGVHHIRKSHPARFRQFGIAEQNMMAAAGGLSAVGLLPVVTTFAVFCLRAVEQARLSIAYCRRNVKIVASHPGLDVGPDGGSAQALEDVAAFRAIPGMTVISPADPVEMTLATRAILEFDGPIYMRTGRSPSKRLFGDDHTFEIGKGQIIREGTDLSIVACGVDMATIKPIDHALLQKCSEETGAIVTAEDHNIYGGLGGAVAESLAQSRPCPMEFVGVRDTFGASGEPQELAILFGIDAAHIAEASRRVLKRKKSS